ncbi:hypothetical protein [Phocoenobacter skyensis]|uniref:Uncharacterized protein n=1 Tax=Phocoenobacter skyensis TaxID=97481 RepID=A0ABT9JI87_9PAST|nr:hypothetical protein [Pasteurella skyensis]MDP8078373.1 hypothetical protein [Pasteurella skyensis]MDP8084535.1 hypothetical protein [Pasteurella skyensis]
MKKYLFHYYFQDSKWGCEIYAHSPQEAKEKIKAMSQAKYDGELQYSISISTKENSLITRLLIKIASCFSKSTIKF